MTEVHDTTSLAYQTGYFHSRKKGNVPVVSGDVVLAIAQDRATSYVIEFVLDNGKTTQWHYRSKDERNEELCSISFILNVAKN
jgi:hypothetical protein